MCVHYVHCTSTILMFFRVLYNFMYFLTNVIFKCDIFLLANYMCCLEVIFFFLVLIKQVIKNSILKCLSLVNTTLIIRIRIRIRIRIILFRKHIMLVI